MGYIQLCIDSISFADEIIVVDSFSTDGTFEYLSAHAKVKVMQHPFNNFTEQKSFALRQANHDWILFVDADEVVPHGLRKEIIATVNNPKAREAYWFYRKFMFKNEHLRFSGWQTDKNHRLFRKSKAKFTHKKLVHETLQIDGSSGKLHAKLTHYCYKDYTDYKGKMLHYGTLKANELFMQGNKFSYMKLLVKPFWKFFYNYIFRFGFLDSARGIKVCYLNALSVFQRYMVLHQLELEQQTKIIRKLPNKAELAQAS